MSRYIDLDEEVHLRDDGEYETYNVRPDAPSIDLVTCRECKYGLETNFIREPYLLCEQWSDDGNARTVKPDDFCSYGDKRDD